MEFLNTINPNIENILFALAIGVIGILIVIILHKFITRSLKRSNVNSTAANFVINLIYGLLLITVSIIVLSKLGVPTASLLTVLGASSLAIALALKDSLSNVAAGLLILFIKPFKKGDLVEISGSTGAIDEINLFATRIRAANNEVYYFPNAKVLNEKIINRTRYNTRRLDLIISVDYQTNLTHARAVLSELIAAESRVLKKPAHLIGVDQLADSAINLTVRMWLRKEDYFAVKLDFLEAVSIAFDKNGIAIPFPQQDVHIKACPVVRTES